MSEPKGDGVKLKLTIKPLASIAEITPAQWQSIHSAPQPMTKPAFFNALEVSGSVCKESGWEPYHLGFYRGDLLVGLLPTYRKTHSYGEYVFDWAWADAYYQHGIPYYPKLLSAVPFTPVPGARLLCRDQDKPALIDGLIDFINEHITGISSWHGLFCDEDLAKRCQDQGLMIRHTVQFQWFNRGYACFDDFLATLTSRKRKSLRKERQKVTASGVTCRFIEGDEITDIQLRRFYYFYQSTYMVRGQQGYLTFDFFSQLVRTMPENVLFLFCYQHGEAIAGAFFLKDAQGLYGRYWGALAQIPSLHFEACYYQGIDYCIQHNIPYFNPGTQGEHKLIRGFEPRLTHSVHWIADARFRPAIANFCQQESEQQRHYLSQCQDASPYKKDGS